MKLVIAVCLPFLFIAQFAFAQNEETGQTQDREPAKISKNKDAKKSENDSEKETTSSQAKAPESKPNDEAAKPVEEDSRTRRAERDYSAFFNYSYYDLLVPGKWGFTFTRNYGADKSWDLEYLKGTLSVPFVIDDLGSFTDERLSLIKRSFAGRTSFNYNYGFSYYRIKLYVGDDILNRITSGSYPSIDLVEVQSLGLNWGVGNRWTLKKGFTIGVDWFAWSQPIFITKEDKEIMKYISDQNDKDDLETTLDFLTYCPRLTFLKLQLGYSF